MLYSVRPAKISDAEAICVLLRRSIVECCTQDHCDNQQVLEDWLRNKTVERVTSWLADENRLSIVALTGMKVVGVAMASLEGEILLCYVLPEVQFTGAGKLLLVSVEESLFALGKATFRLNSTKSAMPFYSRNGFVPAGDAKSIWGLSVMPMVKNVGSQNASAPSR